MAQWFGYEYSEDDQAWGHWCNLEGHWDWWVVGGRWHGWLEDNFSTSVDECQGKYLDLAAIRAKGTEQATQTYIEAQQCYWKERGEDVPPEDAKDYTLYVYGVDVSMPMPEYVAQHQNDGRAYALITPDGAWHDKEDANYAEVWEAALDALQPDDLVTIIDYHGLP